MPLSPASIILPDQRTPPTCCLKLDVTETHNTRNRLCPPVNHVMSRNSERALAQYYLQMTWMIYETSIFIHWVRQPCLVRVAEDGDDMADM